MTTTVKLALKFRSVTYPAYQNKTKNIKKKSQLQRMNSFDYSDDSSLIAREERRRREVSLEGRSRAGIFRSSLSMSTDTTTTLSCSHRSLRNSQDLCCLSSETEDTHHHAHHADRRASFTPSTKSSRKGSELGMSLGNNIERLIDWRRTSPERRIVERSYSYELMQRHCRSPERRTTTENSYCVRRRRLCASTSVPPPAPKSSATEKYPTSEVAAAVITTDRISNEGRRRRLQFRRALSLFSLACSSKELDRDRREEKSPQKRILRPPTRHVYRRGVSGLPIQCSSTYLGLAY